MPHLTHSQRDQLELLLRIGDRNQMQIAALIGCSQSTISRELKRSAPPVHRRYTATTAQRRSQERRKQSYEQRRRWHDDPDVLRYVVKHLRLRWSPEEIEGRMKRQSPWHRRHCVSAKSIYAFIWHNREEGGCLYLHLRRRGKRAKWFGYGKTQRGMIPHRRDISERPKIVEKKTEAGHWESDLVVSGIHGHGAVATFVERFSRYLRAALVTDRSAGAFVDAAEQSLSHVPVHLRRTLTHDNGKEIAGHEQITEKLQMTVYCARPYASWERGCNEYHNGLLRDFFPKGTDFRSVSSATLAHVVDLINNRPRHSLNFRTPTEVFLSEIKDYAFHGSE